MNKKLIILFLAHLFLLYQSQTKPPESYSLMRGVNENINLNRGLVDLSIPLFDIAEGDFKLSNSLNYESRGFVPYLYPSYVGLNWNLNQFGKITRESRKIDLTTTTNKILNPFYGVTGSTPPQYSEFQYSDVRSYDRNDCIKTIYSNNAKKKDIFENNGNYYATNQFEGIAGYQGKSKNYEPDKYYFDFMGYTGYFVVDNNMKPIVYCENASLKVDISGVNCYDIFGNIPFSQFVIQDDKGNKYFFGGNSDALDINFSNNMLYYQYSIDEPPFFYWNNAINRTNYIDSWLLKKVVLANGTEVNAYYRQNDLSILNSFRGVYPAYNSLPSIPQTGVVGSLWFHINENIGFPTKQTLLQNNLSIKYSRALTRDPNLITETQVDTFTKMAVLDSIKINDATIGYKYHNTQNPLELSNNYLDQIIIKRKNKTLKKVDLVYEDLGATNKRTFLKQVKYSTDENIGFDYYNTDDFPEYKNSSATTHIGGSWNGSYSIYSNPSAIEYKNSYDTGLLKKVIYPTKGSTNYSYELSDYSKVMYYQETSSGIQILDYKNLINSPRLKKKVEKSNLSDSLITKYDYLNDLGISSGVFEAGKLTPNHFLDMSSSQRIIGGASANIAGLIKYSLVKVSNEGKGFSKMYFSDYLTNSDTLAVGSTLQQEEYLSKSNERGKLLKEQVYNNSNNLIKETTYKYKNFLSKLPTINNIENCTDCKVSDLNYYIKVKTTPIVVLSNNYFSDNIAYAMYVPTIPYMLSSIETKEYFGNKVIQSQRNITYQDKIVKKYTQGFTGNDGYMWHPYPVEDKMTIDSKTSVKKYLYAIDLYKENPCAGFMGCNFTNDNTIVGGQYVDYQNLHYQNIFTPVIEITKNNENKYSIKENLFSQQNESSNQFNVLKKVRHSKLNANVNFTNYNISTTNTLDDINYDVYDNKANNLQYTVKNGVPVTTIYGYNQTLPVATITGITYNQLMQIFSLPNTSTGYLSLDIISKSNADKDEATEQLLINTLESFRKNPSLANYPITTYTYDPLIGVTSITPPSGIREIYLYDAANRLKEVKQLDKDASGNTVYKTVKEYKYNYKN